MENLVSANDVNQKEIVHLYQIADLQPVAPEDCLPGLLKGLCTFTTMRYTDHGLYFFAEHLKRFQQSVEQLYETSLSEDVCRRALRLGLKSLHEPQSVKLAYIHTSSHGPVLAIYTQTLSTSHGFGESELLRVNFYHGPAPVMGKTKMPHYIFAHSFLHKNPHLDEALKINQRHEIIEGLYSNLLYFYQGQWCTPPLDPSIYSGILLDVWKQFRPKTQERVLKKSEAELVDGLFLMNSVRGIRPVTIEGQSVRANIELDQINQDLSEFHQWCQKLIVKI